MRKGRKEELLNEIGDDVRLLPLIDEMIYLEEELEYLRKLPKIRINAKDKTKQKATPAARMYREALTQYTNIIRVLVRAKGIEDNEDDSPLREWMRKRNEAEV